MVSKTRIASGVNGYWLNPEDNLLDNPRMQVSQENGNSAGATTNYYPADQWFVSFVTSAGVLGIQRVQSATPRGSKDRIRISVTTADTSLAAGEYLIVRQRIEGNRVAHLKWGTANAVPLILRLPFKAPAGTYSYYVTNSATNRSYVANFTVSAANTDSEITVTIPGDTTGTWLTDTGVGLEVGVCLAAGSSWQGVTGWQSSVMLGTSSNSNGLGANTNVFELFDVGLYADTEGLGVAPAWKPKDYAFDLRECQRYYWQGDQTNASYSLAGADQLVFVGYTSTNYDNNAYLAFPAEMRVVPTITRTNTGCGLFPTTALATVASRNGVSEIRRGTGPGNGYFVTSVKANARM